VGSSADPSTARISSFRPSITKIRVPLGLGSRATINISRLIALAPSDTMRSVLRGRRPVVA
jgi:hypothetical protein